MRYNKRFCRAEFLFFHLNGRYEFFCFFVIFSLFFHIKLQCSTENNFIQILLDRIIAASFSFKMIPKTWKSVEKHRRRYDSNDKKSGNWKKGKKPGMSFSSFMTLYISLGSIFRVHTPPYASYLFLGMFRTFCKTRMVKYGKLGTASVVLVMWGYHNLPFVFCPMPSIASLLQFVLSFYFRNVDEEALQGKKNR